MAFLNWSINLCYIYRMLNILLLSIEIEWLINFFFSSDALAIEAPQEQGRKRSAKQRTPKKIHQQPLNDA